MIVSAWYDGHSTYGVRILDREVSLWFRPEWETVEIRLPDRMEPVEIPIDGVLEEQRWTDLLAHAVRDLADLEVVHHFFGGTVRRIIHRSFFGIKKGRHKSTNR